MGTYRKRGSVLRVTIALLVIAAAAIGSFASVCRASCCVAAYTHVQSQMPEADHSCCSSSTSEEAARFFADEPELGSTVLAAQAGESTPPEACVANLRLGTEYPAPAPASDVQTPAADQAVSFTCELPRNTGVAVTLSHTRGFVRSPGSPPLYLSVSSFLC